MSSDEDDTFDYGSELSNRMHFPADCQNEVEGIECFYKCFIRRYNACPAFFMGSLQDACESAFSSPIVKEHRPILVYIHNDKSLLSNIFCSTMFCSEVVVNYLLENYIVWPWDITSDSNKTTLMRIWKELFSREISVEQCPLLIGIMGTSNMERYWSLTLRYRFTLLLEYDKLTRTQEKSTRQTLLQELIQFKEESDKNEQLLLFDFVTKTRLPWDIVLEIAKYLTLNDAVIAFSPMILLLFEKYKTKLHLSEFSEPFINMILEKINVNQIVSLRINASESSLKTELSSLEIFNHITSLILLNSEPLDLIGLYEISFPNLTSLSLCFDNEINFRNLPIIVSKLQNSIKRFAIHCVAASCSHYFSYPLQVTYMPKTTIEYFLLDIRHLPLASINSCSANYQSCFLMQLITLMKVINNIRYVHLITNQYNIKKLLDIDQWKSLISECHQLKKVTVEVMGTILPNERLIQKVLEIQKELHNMRQTIRFQVLFS